MNSKKPARSPRPYTQKSRAEAAEASTTRILEAFLKRAENQWFEDITLEALAKDAEVTVQTVMRKFGGKAGILKVAHEHMGKDINVRRSVKPGDVDHSVDVLTKDYETVGRLVLRLLSQEERQPTLKPVLEEGRRGHREWLAEVFAEKLATLTPARRTAMLDALVIAADIYIWKLVRIDMGRPVAAFKAVVKRMLHAALSEA